MLHEVAIVIMLFAEMPLATGLMAGAAAVTVLVAG